MIKDYTENSRDWAEFYRLAEKYYEKHGNLLMPKRIAEEGFEDLIPFLSAQRKAYAMNVLPKNYIEKLNKLDIEWSSFNAEWKYNYPNAVKYYNEHKDLLVPRRFKEKGYEGLDDWLHDIRKLNKCGRLSDFCRAKLNKLEMVWEPFEYQWNIHYPQAEEYFKENGNLNIAGDCKDEKYRGLYQWICNMRSDYNHTNPLVTNPLLTKEKIEELDNLQMQWHFKDIHWDRFYGKAEQYYEEYGNLIPSRKYISPEYKGLPEWLDNQRSLYESDKLERSKIEKLEQLDMPWNMKYLQWERKWWNYYGVAQEHFEKYKTHHFEKDQITPGYEDIESWLKSQQNAYKDRKLLPEEISALNKINALKDREIITFDEWVERAKSYKAANGDLMVPYRYESEELGKLGAWITRQRHLHKNNKLSSDRVESLEKIGMSWSGRTIKKEPPKMAEAQDVLSNNNIDSSKRGKVTFNINEIERMINTPKTDVLKNVKDDER